MWPVLSAGCLLLAAAPSADKPAYALFAAAGQPAAYRELLRAALLADVVLCGEQHGNAVCHWLERELAADLFAEIPGRLVLGAEMIETDDQLKLDEFLAGTIRAQDFRAEAKVWKNHDDYQPLLDFAQAHKIPFVASNVPRRYAALVARDGLSALDRLSNAAKQLIAPLPLTVDLKLPGYQGLIAMAGGGQHGGVKGENLARAQAVKDATMAWSILKAHRPGQVFLHFNGTYHSERHEGIVWYLRHAKPDLKVVTVAATTQDHLAALAPASQGLADFVLVTTPHMSAGG